MRSGARACPRPPLGVVWKITLPNWKATGRGFGRQKARISARLEDVEGVSRCYHHMRVCAGAGAHVPFNSFNPSSASIIICKLTQIYKIKQHSGGRVAPPLPPTPSSFGRATEQARHVAWSIDDCSGNVASDLRSPVAQNCAATLIALTATPVPLQAQPMETDV